MSKYKLKIAFKCLPYIEIREAGDKAGSSKFFITRIYDGAADTTDEHEEVHILFWYIVSAIMVAVFGVALAYTGLPLFLAILGVCVEPLLGTYSQRYNIFEESFAYARAATLKDNPEKYLRELEKSKAHTDRYGLRFVDKVRKRMRWFK